MNDFEAIRRLIALYGQLLDAKRLAEWGELFTEDAVFRVWGQTHRGRAAIVREIGGMQAEAPGKHVVLQPVIDWNGGDAAWAWTDLCALATTASKDAAFGRNAIGIATMGRYHDRLKRSAEDGRWRIEERVLVMAGETVPDGVADSPPY